MALTAGIGNMPAGKVTLYSLTSIAVWNGLIIFAGLAVGANWTAVRSVLSTYSRIILILFMAIVALFLLRFFVKRKKDRREYR